jgi:hypothetical protein
MKKAYKLNEAGIRAMQRRTIQTTATMFGIVALAILCIEVVRLDWSRISNWISVPFAFLVVFGVVVFILDRGRKQMRVMFESIVIELEEEAITKRQLRSPGLRIPRNEVVRLQETKNGLIIHTANKYDAMLVPIGLEGYEEVKAQISSWVIHE